MKTFEKFFRSFGNKVVAGITICLLVLTSVYFAYGHGDEKHEEIVTAGKSKYPIVTVVKPKLAHLDTTNFEVTGVVHAKNQSDIYPLKSGNVTELLVKTGDFVKKGAVLARITSERSDAQIGSDIALLKKEIEILGEQKLLVKNNNAAKIRLLSDTNDDKKKLLINNKSRKEVDQANKVLPLQTEVDSQKLEQEIAKKQYENDISSLEIQLENARTQLNNRQLIIDNSIIDVIDATANFLYEDANRIENFKLNTRSNIRSEIEASHRENSYEFSYRFLQFYKQYRAKEIVGQKLAGEALSFAAEARLLSNNAAISTGGEFSERLDELDESIDHYGEVQTDNGELLTRVQDLETQKLTKKLEFEQKNLEINQTIENLELQISRQNTGIDTNLSVESQNLDAELSITTQDLELETEIEQKNLDIQIANKRARIDALQKQWGWGTVVRAPFSGNIVAQHVSVGTSVSTSKALFSMVDESEKFIRFYVSEDQYPFVREGKEIKFYSPFSPSENFTTQISRVSKSLSENTKQILVEADISNRDDLERVLVNMNVKVLLPLFSSEDNSSDALLYALPQGAINLSGNSNKIWFIDERLEAFTKDITTDFFFNGTSYVSDGLTGKEWVIIASPVELSEGLEIDTKLYNNQD